MNGSMAHDGAWMMETSRLPGIMHYWDTNARTGERERVYWELDAAFGLVLASMCTGFLNLTFIDIFMNYNKLHPGPTVFKVSLAFTHVFQLKSSVMLAMMLRQVTCHTNLCGALVEAWSVCSYSGVILHLLVVLEFMLIQMTSNLSSNFQHPCWNLPVVLALYLIGLASYNSPEAYVFMGSVALALTYLVVIFACISWQSMDKRLMLAVLSAVLTFGLTYLPSFVAVCMQLNHVYDTRFIILMSLTNMRLITDGFLCWVICWGPREDAQGTWAWTWTSEDGQVNLEPPSCVSFQTNMSESNF